MYRLFPEYEAVGTLLFAFQHQFCHTRFGFGRIIAESSRILRGVVEIEVSYSSADRPFLVAELGYEAHGVDARRIVESNSVFHCMSKTVPRW